MTLSTTVNIDPSGFTLDMNSRVMLIGSCFAQHVGEHLLRELNEGMVDSNPFGVLYNPISIAQALRMLMAENGRQLASSYVFRGQDGMWHSWMHTSHFSANTAEECIEKIKVRYDVAREFLKHTSLLCVTFGTTRGYFFNDDDDGDDYGNDNDDDDDEDDDYDYENDYGNGYGNGYIKEKIVVANCHKEPQRCFTEYDPSLEELTSLWRDVLDELKTFNPDLKVCFTVSPYRYKKYGFHVSQIQKAKLLLLIENLKCDTSYFPVYEIVMDELRDYRFYADDMLHPSDLAVSIIYQRFKDWLFTDALKRQCAENLKVWKRSQHRVIKTTYE